MLQEWSWQDNAPGVRSDMLRLTKIGVGGFKSIKDLQPLALNPITVLVGANGAGKSNLISFFRLLNAIPALKLQEFVGHAGGADDLLYYGVKETPAMWAQLYFEGKTGPGVYSFWLSSTATHSLIFSEEKVHYKTTSSSDMRAHSLGSGHRESLLIEQENHFVEVWELLTDLQTFHFEDTSETAAIRRPGYIDDNRHLRNDGGNLAAYLYGLRHRQPDFYKRVIEAIRLIVPFFDDFDLAPGADNPNQIRLSWRDRDSTHLFGPHQLSDGTLRAMALSALLAQPEDRSGLIVLDEPEIGLHPYAIEVIAALIKRASIYRPILLATQSVAMVNQFAPEDVVTVTRENAQSRFERQSAESLAAWLEDYAVGDLWAKNVIGGNPLR